jgi:hypothetical protein
MLKIDAILSYRRLSIRHSIPGHVIEEFTHLNGSQTLRLSGLKTLY